jgi:flagellar biosynthesis/type III secretory pathway chaperone
MRWYKVIDVEEVMEKLIEISKKKSDILNDIYSLTVDQSRVIANEDIDGLNELIDKKQVCIDEAKELDAQFEKIVDDLKLVYGVNRLDEIEICKTEVEKIQIVVKAIMDKVKLIRKLEMENSDLLREMKDSIERKITSIKVGKKAVSNYGYGSFQQPVYFDKNN